jgi:Fe-S cluster assembly iron-binding protein IscA
VVANLSADGGLTAREMHATGRDRRSGGPEKEDLTTMVNVTERAKAKLKEILETEDEDRVLGLRLQTTPSGQFGVILDRERADDQIVEHQGAVVLLVGQEVAPKVEDTTIDYDESGPGLVIKRS